MGELALIMHKDEGKLNTGPFGVDIIETLYHKYSHLLKEEPNSPSYTIFPSLRSIPIINRYLPALNEKKVVVQSLLAKQRSAITYKEWFEISLQLDEVLDNNAWKQNPESNIYDHELVFSNLMEMRNARLANDYKLLLYLIRTKWHRNLGNMGDINLYRHSHVGTKKLIEDYINECETCLDYLINGEDINLDDRYLLGMLIQTRKNIGRTALVLSGGSTFGIFHIGVVITLLESNLLPRIISGSSAGSIIASIICSHSNDDTLGILNDIMEKKFNIFGNSEQEDEFHDEQFNFKASLNNLGHLLKYGTLFDITALKSTMIGFVGDLTFREAYNRTGRILNITVSPTSIHEQTRLLNYLTAPNCLIWSAICASCSLPGVFPSTLIYEKVPKTNGIQEWNNDDSMKFVDGSVDNDLPITRLSEMFNADHIIACQVNPHVVPILKVSVSSIGGEVENELNYKFKNFLNNCYDFVTSEIIHYLQILNEMDVYKTFSSKLITLISQHYSGDITILPDYKNKDFLKVFDNPTPEFLLDFIIRGARASWPKMTVIYNHCGVEFALDKSITLLRGRLITSSNNQISHRNSPNMHNHNQNITLVNLPVMNTDSPSTPITPEKSRMNSLNGIPPNIKRHNSASSTIDFSSNINKAGKFKRNSISVAVPSMMNNRIQKGRSTTSLASLSSQYSQNQNMSTETTLINDDNKSGKYFNTKRPENQYSFSENPKNFKNYTENYTEKMPARQFKDFQERQKIRKAKSSGNFHVIGDNNDSNNQSLKYQTERIPYYKGNPYLEPPLRFSSFNYDGDNEGLGEDEVIKEIVDSTNGEIEKEKANLPKLSNSNSLRNSYVGLNRLKDNYLSKSNNNSSYNLKDAYNSELIHNRLINLHSPDLRRSYSKSFLNDTKFSQGLSNSTDNEEDEEKQKKVQRSKAKVDGVKTENWQEGSIKKKEGKELIRQENEKNGKVLNGVKDYKSKEKIDENQEVGHIDSDAKDPLDTNGSSKVTEVPENAHDRIEGKVNGNANDLDNDDFYECN